MRGSTLANLRSVTKLTDQAGRFTRPEVTKPSGSALKLKAPFPYFGGKSMIAGAIWQRLGDVDNYVEPFMGSLAVLLGRPAEHTHTTETVNDVDHYLVNFWRALQADPDGVAKWADWLPNECDLTARHIWLVNEGRERIAHLEADPFAYDVQVAGWWVWGIALWIGSGWCSGKGPWISDGRRLIRKTAAARGVNRQLIHLGNAGRGVNNFATSRNLTAYMHFLADRLRHVRVCCGDWTRVVTTGALSHGKTVGVLLDPPYAISTGREVVYNHESDASAAVREWAIANGENPRYRIALCGYDGEHDMPPTWEVVAWRARSAFKSSNVNRHRERVWFSPHCLKPDTFGVANEPLELWA